MDTPISNEAYDVLTMLQSKLEALQTYDKYSKDMHDGNKKLLDQLRQDDYHHVELLTQTLEAMACNGGLKKT